MITQKGSAEELTNKNDKGLYDIETENLTLIAIVVTKDNLRPEVPGAVASCKTAKIKVRMVTGANKITAKACGILIDENVSLILEGPDFVNRIGGVICKRCRTAICDFPKDYVEGIFMIQQRNFYNFNQLLMQLQLQ